MTSSITQLPAASNGTDTTTGANSAQREHGISRVQEQLVYHVTSLAQAVLYEAERLMAELSRSASFTRTHDGIRGSEPVDMAHVAAVLGETLDCIDVASEQLSRLNVDIRMRLEPDDGF